MQCSSTLPRFTSNGNPSTIGRFFKVYLRSEDSDVKLKHGLELRGKISQLIYAIAKDLVPSEYKLLSHETGIYTITPFFSQLNSEPLQPSLLN